MPRLLRPVVNILRTSRHCSHVSHDNECNRLHDISTEQQPEGDYYFMSFNFTWAASCALLSKQTHTLHSNYILCVDIISSSNILKKIIIYNFYYNWLFIY